MTRFYERAALMLLCLAGLVMEDNFIEPVAVAIGVVMVSILAQLMTGKWMAAALIIVASAVCGWVPPLFCGVPLLVYDALWEQKWYLILPALLVFKESGALHPAQYIIAFAGAGVSVLLYLLVSRNEEAVEKYHLLRDELAEKNVMLESQNARLKEAQNNEVHLATLKERNRIAREIHDNVGHMLTRSLLQSGALMIANKDENLKEPLEGLNQTLDQAMTSIRESVHDLHDESIDLQAAIGDNLKTVENRFATTLNYDVKTGPPTSVKLCFAGIVKEAISNAVKHSNGDKIEVTVGEKPGVYELIITDNGQAGEIKQTGIGLSNMRDRVGQLHGHIEFATEDGFIIRVGVPK